MGRPVGVTILAILDFLGAALCVLGGIGMLVGGGAIATAINQQAGSSGAGAGLVAAMGAGLGVVMLVFAAIYALVGWGLWALKNWARIITIVLLVIGIGFSLLGLVGTLTHFTIGRASCREG